MSKFFIDEAEDNQINKAMVPFTEEAVKEYLDKRIAYWRKKSEDKKDNVSRWYADVYRNVREDLFGL